MSKFWAINTIFRLAIHYQSGCVFFLQWEGDKHVVIHSLSTCLRVDLTVFSLLIIFQLHVLIKRFLWKEVMLWRNFKVYNIRFFVFVFFLFEWIQGSLPVYNTYDHQKKVRVPCRKLKQSLTVGIHRLCTCNELVYKDSHEKCKYCFSMRYADFSVIQIDTCQ